SSMAKTRSASWSYIWISEMLAPAEVTWWTIGSASPRLSGPTAVMMTCILSSPPRTRTAQCRNDGQDRDSPPYNLLGVAARRPCAVLPQTTASPLVRRTAYGDNGELPSPGVLRRELEP